MLLYCEAFRFSSCQMPPQAVIVATVCGHRSRRQTAPVRECHATRRGYDHIVDRCNSSVHIYNSSSPNRYPNKCWSSTQDHLAICQILPITYARVACIPCNLLRLEPTRQGPRSIAREVNPCLVPTNAASSAEHNV
jgi:hypothetical protein